MNAEDKNPMDEKVNLIKVEEGESKEEFKKRVIGLFRKRGLIEEKEKPEPPTGVNGEDC